MFDIKPENTSRISYNAIIVVFLLRLYGLQTDIKQTFVLFALSAPLILSAKKLWTINMLILYSNHEVSA